MSQPVISKKDFTLMRRAKSFVHAGRGLWLFLKTTPNAWLHIIIFLGVNVAAWWLSISYIEWLLLVIMGTLVIASEAFNTAIEIDINLTSPEFHPYARDTKDVAAAAVLITALGALVVGGIIFGRYILVNSIGLLWS